MIENDARVLEARIELATSETLLKEGKGTVESVHTPGSSFGSAAGEIETEVTGLTPSTPYYVRFFAVAESVGSAEKIFPFTTHAPEAPEIGEVRVPEIEGGEGEGFELGPTYAAFQAAPLTSVELTKWDPAGIEANGADTTYHFEYATSSGTCNPPAIETGCSWQPFTSGATGTVTKAEDTADPKAKLTGLTPETNYFVRLRAENGLGAPAVKIRSFKTTPATPRASSAGAMTAGVGATSVSVQGYLQTRGYETNYRFEDTTEPENPGSWTPVPGAEGTIAAVPPAELGASERIATAVATITGLTPATKYFVRLVVENEHGESTSPTSQPFETSGPPVAFTFATHALRGEAIRILGAVKPNTPPVAELQTITLGGTPTGGAFTLRFEAETTAPIAFNARGIAVAKALRALTSIQSKGNVEVIGNSGGPYTVQFLGAKGSDQPPIEADASGLTPSGTVTVATAQNGLSYDNRYHFEYTTSDFSGCGTPANPGCLTTAEVDLGTGAKGEDRATIVGQDPAGLEPGKTYDFRLLATNTTSGNPVVDGPVQSLTVPTPAPPTAPPACPNEARRTGPSSHLPDCRAFEQVTPAEKEGSMDNWTYSAQLLTPALVGEDGEHLWVKPQFSKWGPNADASSSSYFFAREEERGWQMTSPTPQPQAGAEAYGPTLFSPDLTHIGLNVGWTTTTFNASPEVGFKAGSPGGPYTTVATVARAKHTGWVGASRDFSKLVLESESHTLLGPSTGTASGSDLYEYSAGQLQQLNVTGPSPGLTIGTCGATMAKTAAGGAPGGAVSADGSRVFFEAVPGSNCSEPKHLYMRVGGAETVDVGTYSLLAANADGSELLLLRKSGEAHEFFLYETESTTTKPLFSTQVEVNDLGVSENLSEIYFTSKEQLTPEAPPLSAGSEDSGPDPSDLYRYDVSAEALRFVVQASGEGGDGGGAYVSPDGRYYYWASSGVAAVFREVDPGAGDENPQVYRYDSVENLVQCMSCASPFDPKPQRFATFLRESIEDTVDSAPRPSVASPNGDYVFFDTAAALVPQDVDGEVHPCVSNICDEADQPGNHGFSYSISSDVYEWRKDGVDGCSRIQGCLALITSGAGGVKNILLGTAHEGRDVFFATHSQLAPTDTDAQGDVYDARIGGGFPPPPLRPVECEGDACSHPVPAPNDETPASLTYHGPGNEHPTRPGRRTCKKGFVLKHGHCVKSHKTHRRKHKRVGANHGGHK